MVVTSNSYWKAVFALFLLLLNKLFVTRRIHIFELSLIKCTYFFFIYLSALLAVSAKLKEDATIFLMESILFLYYAESLVTSNLNSKLFRFHSAHSIANKVHIFREGRKIWQNLHRRFDCYYMGQISRDFARICGSLRIYEPTSIFQYCRRTFKNYLMKFDLIV